MTFNIKKLAIASEGTMQVLDPKKSPVKGEDGKDLSITLQSPGTREYQSAKHKHDEKINEINMRRLKGGTVAEGEAEQITAEFFATVTKSFNGFDYDGQGGFNAYKAAYLDPELDLSEQVNKYLGDRGNFFSGLSKNSSNTSGT